MRKYRSKPATIKSVKRELVGDSIERKRLVDKLIKLVRAEERAKIEEDR